MRRTLQAGNIIWIPLLIIAALSVVGFFVYLKATSVETAPPNNSIVTTNDAYNSGDNATSTSTSSPATTDNKSSSTVAVLKTSLGEIEVELLPNKTPQTVQNFVKLAKDGFYNGTRFHRVIKNFMIQGGDPLSKDLAYRTRWGTGGPGYSFPDELTGQEKYPAGTLAMANSGPNTNGSQFFIVTGASVALQPDYTVFGKVISGQDVADKISFVKTNVQDQPVQDVVLESVTIK